MFEVSFKKKNSEFHQEIKKLHPFEVEVDVFLPDFCNIFDYIFFVWNFQPNRRYMSTSICHGLYNDTKHEGVPLHTWDLAWGDF
jgi:hypothetical protein